MYAVEFEADIRNGTVKVPEIYRHFDNVHAKVVLLVNDDRIRPQSEVELDFSSTEIKSFSAQDALSIQKAMRDEW